MDDVLEENLPNHALPEQKEMAEKYRNIGIGVMGIGDALIKLGITYGSDIAITAIGDWTKFIFRTALKASVKLAETRGNFPGYSEKIWDSTIIKNAFFDFEISEFRKKNKLRNCSLLSIAPTGSLGTMLNISTGIEPLFALEYTRRTVSLGGKEEYHKVQVPIIEEAMKHYNWHPECYITAYQIPYKQRVDMQAAAQRYIDTAISSTVNLPKETTPEDIQSLYLYAWNKGLKGVTVYRDGSRDPILSTSTSEQKECLESAENSVKIDSKRGDIVKAGDDCVGLKRTLMTGCGTLHVSAFFDPKTGELRETYLSKGSTGGCNNFMIGLSRMISLAARGGISVDNIVDQLKSCGSCPSYAVRKATKGDVSLGSCCPVAIGNALLEMNKEIQSKLEDSSIVSGIPISDTITQDEIKDKCPECGAPLEHSSGCMSCPSCGYSKCG